MRWVFFFMLAYVLLGLEVAAQGLLSIDGRSAPSLLLVLAVFVAMSAAPLPALWGALWLGLLTDLTRPLPWGAAQDVAIPGPAALGMVFAVAVVLQLRTMVRRSTVGLAIMVMVAGLFANLAAVALLSIRGLPWLPGEPIPDFSALDALAQRFVELLYTTLASLPLGFLLARGQRWFGFELGKSTTPGHVMR